MSSPDTQYEEYLEITEEPPLTKNIPQNALIGVGIVAILIVFMVQVYGLPWKEGAMYFAILALLVWALMQKGQGPMYLTVVQAQMIVYNTMLDAQVYKNKYSTEIPSGDVAIGEGVDLILNPWDGEPRWRRIGFSIRDKQTRAPSWYYADIDIFVNGRGVDRITPLSKEYQCEPLIIKLKPVLVSEYKETENFLKKHG